MNKFVKKTISALNVDSTDPLLAKGFTVDNNKKEDVVLVLGINPAGYEKEANYEREHKTYIGYAGGLKIKGQVNNKYHGGIYKLVNDTTNSCKPLWCTKPFSQAEEVCTNLKQKDLDKLKNFYNSHKDNKYTIYGGDLFYYHTTNFKEFESKIKFKDSKDSKDLHNYAIDMLKMHIDELKSHNKLIKYIYINNAHASNLIQDNVVKSYEYIEGIPVFFGGMLSGVHAMDKSSIIRLKNEIKNVVKF